MSGVSSIGGFFGAMSDVGDWSEDVESDREREEGVESVIKKQWSGV